MAPLPMKDVANLRWAGFYIPVLSWSYLFFDSQDEGLLPFIAVAILGATIWHGIFRSIFGSEGPEANPKKTWMVAGYFFALMYVKKPGGNPDSIDEFFERLSSSVTLYRTMRFLVLLALSAGYFFLTFYSLPPLYELAVQGPGDALAGILLLSQTLFLIQGIVFNRFASVIPPESAEWMWVPEFRRANVVIEENEDEFRFRDSPGIINDLKSHARDVKKSIEDDEKE